MEQIVEKELRCLFSARGPSGEPRYSARVIRLAVALVFLHNGARGAGRLIAELATELRLGPNDDLESAVGRLFVAEPTLPALLAELEGALLGHRSSEARTRGRAWQRFDGARPVTAIQARPSRRGGILALGSLETLISTGESK